MKISYISNVEIPSATANSIQIMKMCSAFRAGGNEVVLYAPRSICLWGRKQQDIIKQYGLRRSFKIVKIPFLGSSNYLLHKLSYRLFLVVYTFITALCILGKHQQLVYGRSLIPLLLLAILGRNIIYEIHTPPHNRLKWMLLDMLVRIKSCRRIVVISQRLKDALRPKISTDKILVAHDGADMPEEENSEYMPDEYLKDFQRVRNAGYTGHLYPGKGGELIIEMAKKMKDMNFHIFGGLKEDRRRLTSKGEIPSNVVFHGIIEHYKVASVIRRMDVLLLPVLRKVYAYGGRNIADFMSPLKLFEYMASGVPIVCSDIPVLREVLEHGHNALLCDPDNLNEWTDALSELLSDSETARRIAGNAKADCLQKYTWSMRAENVIKDAL